MNRTFGLVLVTVTAVWLAQIGFAVDNSGPPLDRSANTSNRLVPVPAQPDTATSPEPVRQTNDIGTTGGVASRGILVPGNDDCANAERLAIPSFDVSFDTTAATVDGAPDCQGVSNTAPGVWYSVIGTGNTITASTCTEFCTYDTQISVYCAGCDELMCAAANDNNCMAYTDTESQVSWCSEGGVEYLILVHGNGSATGGCYLAVWDDGTDCLDPPRCTPCHLTCPAGSTPEGEPDCGLPDDTTNGGCNSIPPVFSSIVCGETVCGTVAFDGGTRDTDWYEITVTEDTQFTWTVTGEAGVQIGVADMAHSGSADCSDHTHTLVPFAYGEPCEEVSVTVCLGPGTHWFFVAPTFSEVIDCGAEYIATLTCDSCTAGACCLPDGRCLVLGETDCTDRGGIWEGADEDCDPNCCPQSYDLGADECSDAMAHYVLVNGLPKAIGGDNSAATGPEGCTNVTLDAWWEAFTIDECADVFIDYCCTEPMANGVYGVLVDDCVVCDLIYATDNSWTGALARCDDGSPDPGNIRMLWESLPAGTYYYPVLSNVDAVLPGPYQLHVTAHPCTSGACCANDGTCLGTMSAVYCAELGGTPSPINARACMGDSDGDGVDDACGTGWHPGDPHKMHFPQLPDEAGWDVNATQPLVLADDWMCSETGWVKDVHFWGSWKDGIEGEILGFVLSIHEDIPVDPPEIPYSRPGTTLWEAEINNFGATPLDPPTSEGWYDPSIEEVLWDNHKAYFQYDVYLPEELWFWQNAGTIYWLNISAIVADPEQTTWGWKSSLDHWNDDAVWAFWSDLRWVDLWQPEIPIHDEYWVEFDELGRFAGGGGTGFADGEWFYYENTEWWNEWFYDHPFDPERKKEIHIEFDAASWNGMTPGLMTLALNWATPEWSELGREFPPLPPLTPEEEEKYIGRDILFAGEVLQPATYVFDYEFPDFNPEWISIDVMGWNFRIGVERPGFIDHTCIGSLDLAFVITGGVPFVGACCYDDPLRLCDETTRDKCVNNLNGVYEGDGTICEGMEACCILTVGAPPICMDADALCCRNELGGIPQGPGTSCTEPQACCLDDDTCVMVDPLCCDDMGGTPQGDGTMCKGMEACCLPIDRGAGCVDADALCCRNELGGTPQGPGTACAKDEACCFAEGRCMDLDPLCCVSELGGTPQGEDTTCTREEACCLDDGTCVMVDPLCCDDMGGVPQGDDTMCKGMEACCIVGPDAPAICMDADALCCRNELGGIPQGPGTSCGAREACCLDDAAGTCVMVDPLCCDDMGGTAQGAGSSCTTEEACCLNDGTCIMVDPLCCDDMGGVPQGSGTVCTREEGCCLDDGTCVNLDPLCCENIGGTPQGPGTACVDTTIACCLRDGSCVDVDPLCCDDLGGQPSPIGEPFCLGDLNGNGIDDACEEPQAEQACCLLDGGCIDVLHMACVGVGGDPQGPGTTCAGVVCHPLKWSQAPVFSDESPFPTCFWGWDEPSVYASRQIVADDWLCLTEHPVTDIHWWGSYVGWELPEPPPEAPLGFRIGLWTDVEAGVDQEWSHPGRMFQEWFVDRRDARERPVGCDFHRDHDFVDTCFRYDFMIPEEEWFYQPPRPTIFWVSIAAVYDIEPGLNVWGWKTREHFFNDDAVRIFLPTDPVPGSEFIEGEPIVDLAGLSWDMAFVITTKVDMDNLLETYPPHCAIDARQPHALINPAVKYGWDSLLLVFEFDPTSMGLVPADFTVATYSNGIPATPPGISAVITDGPAHAVTIKLDQMIEPRNWTCITHTDSGKHWCMGYLPADVNQDGLSATQDINKLIDCLNLVAFPPCGIWQTDIDRSGLPMPQDILREIDLLNGAIPFDVWITENLPDCP